MLEGITQRLKMSKTIRICKYCGITSNETRIYTDVCRKHYIQLSRHGRIFERTIKDVNEIVLHCNYAEIILYNKKCEEVSRVKIDLEDVEKIKDTKWYLKHGYAVGTVNDGKKLHLHRFIVNCPRDYFVDHINGDRLDSRKYNLRICTKAENSRNNLRKGKLINGIGFNVNKSGKWTATIMVDYKYIWLGTFKTEQEAIHARIEAEKKYFGEFSSYLSRNHSSTTQ